MAKTTSRSAQSHADAELSEAARAVVRDQGDPRIDVHLAALGLGADPAPASPRGANLASAAEAELTGLRDRVGALERDLAAARSRSQVLAVLLALAVVAIVVLVALRLA
jgi:hypothetical protein